MDLARPNLRWWALPFWALAASRSGLVRRFRPVVILRVDARNPLPDPEHLLELARDPKVGGLRLVLAGAGAGWATLLRAHAALQAVREAGKVVVAEVEHAGNAEMLLASAASRVYLRPGAHLFLVGIGAQLRFWGGALERLGVRVDVEAAGAYKSFGEAYSRRFASGANREAVSDVVADLQEQVVSAVARGRGCAAAVVSGAMADAPLTAEEARVRGLVDGVRYPDEVESELEESWGRRPRAITWRSWWRARSLALRLDRWIAGGTRIVVVHLEGPVVDGPGAPGATAIADVPTRKLLDGLARDDAVAGVVLAVQSPGGSAQASELIWRAIRRLGEQKPVVAALGNVAASGGYYIAVAAREILAHPATLTGSIGVVAAKVVVGGALGKLGATSEAVLGAPQADFFSGESPFSDEQRRRFRVVLAETYARFVGRVAEGRGRTPEDTEPLAQGRVWLGTRAVASGLADGFGDVDAAVRRVAELAAVQRPRRVDAWVSPRANRLFARLRPGLVAEVWLRQLREQPGKVLAVAEVEIDLG